MTAFQPGDVTDPRAYLAEVFLALPATVLAPLSVTTRREIYDAVSSAQVNPLRPEQRPTSTEVVGICMAVDSLLKRLGVEVQGDDAALAAMGIPVVES